MCDKLRQAFEMRKPRKGREWTTAQAKTGREATALYIEKPRRGRKPM
jgi:hypothetical protein